MKVGTLTLWAKRGWLLDEIVVDGPGEIINVGSKPHYVGEKLEKGYVGNSHQLIASRYAMGMKLGRPLTRNELLRFSGDNKQDLRLSNLILHSKQATSAEFLKANGVPVLGYSHCICGCGTELDLAKQKIQPYAFVEGHQPVRKEHGNLKRARPSMPKVLVEKLTKETMPTPEDSLKEFRALFEKMIHSLPWEEFKELLQLLLEIQTRKKGKE